MPQARSVRVGLHARNDVTFTEGDYRLIRDANIETLKILSLTQTAVFQRLRQENPNLDLLVRLHDARVTTSHPPAEAFAAAAIARLQELRPFATRFEIHNEPNHVQRYEGWGSTDQDARSFREWYLEVLRRLREACPWARFGFPGLAPQGPHRDLEWLEVCHDAIQASDWLGCHAYWQKDNALSDDWGLRFKAYHSRFPDKVIEITEFGNSTADLSGDDLAEDYVAYFRELFKYPYLGSASAFIASSPDPQWARFVWLKEGGEVRSVARAVASLARPALAAPVAEQPKPMYKAEWLEYRPPASLASGQRAAVGLKVKNAGTMTWFAGQVRIGYHWSTPQGAPVSAVENLRTELPANIGPGMTVTLTQVLLSAPPLPGEFVVKWDLVQGEDGWFSFRGSPTFNVTAKVAPRRIAEGTFFAQTGCTVTDPFLVTFNRYGTDLFGYPATDAFDEAGLPTQYLQNAVLQQEPTSDPQFRAAGTEVVTARPRIAGLQVQVKTLSTQVVALRTRLAALTSGLVPQPQLLNVVDSLPRHATLKYDTRTLDKIENIVVHHTAVPGTIGPKEIARYQANVRGWPGIGYHFVIMPDGTIYQTNRLESTSFHARQANPTSIGVAFAGNFDSAIPTEAQLQSGGRLMAWLLQTLKLDTTAIKGHRDFVQN